MKLLVLALLMSPFIQTMPHDLVLCYKWSEKTVVEKIELPNTKKSRSYKAKRNREKKELAKKTA